MLSQENIEEPKSDAKSRNALSPSLSPRIGVNVIKRQSESELPNISKQSLMVANHLVPINEIDSENECSVIQNVGSKFQLNQIGKKLVPSLLGKKLTYQQKLEQRKETENESKDDLVNVKSPDLPLKIEKR